MFYRHILTFIFNYYNGGNVNKNPIVCSGIQIGLTCLTEFKFAGTIYIEFIHYWLFKINEYTNIYDYLNDQPMNQP